MRASIPNDTLARIALSTLPRRAFFTAGMSARKGIEELDRVVAGSEVVGTEVAAATPITPPPRALTFRLKFDDAFAGRMAGAIGEVTAAAAEEPPPRERSIPSRRARRSSRESILFAETARFLEREFVGAIAGRGGHLL